MRKHIELASWIAGIISTLIAIYILTETKGLISTDDIEPARPQSIQHTRNKLLLRTINILPPVKQGKQKQH